MPFTPFHFGPGAALHACAPRSVSFLSFCAANILIDLESLHNLLLRQEPVHAFFHTFVGATVAILATLGLYTALRAIDGKASLPNLFDWRSLTLWQVACGAMLGAYSHVLLDSIMHSDAQPFAPFAQGNPLLGVVAVDTLHIACVVLGGAGVLLLLLRSLHRGKSAA